MTVAARRAPFAIITRARGVDPRRARRRRRRARAAAAAGRRDRRGGRVRRVARRRAGPQPRGAARRRCSRSSGASGRRRFRVARPGRPARRAGRLRRSRVPLVPQLAEALRSAARRELPRRRAASWPRSATTPRRASRSSARAAPRPLRAAVRRGPRERGRRPRPRRLHRRRPRTLRADVCVIGAGAGGAVVAKELAEGGARVVVLEEGGEPPRRDADRPPARHARAAVPRRRAGRHARPPADRAAARPRASAARRSSTPAPASARPTACSTRWRAEFGLEGAHAGRARARVRPRRGRRSAWPRCPPELAGANAALIRRGAERLGWSGGYLRRNARGCQGSGVCAFGCPTGAKQHAGDAYLAPARAAGALACTGARAERVVMRGRARGRRRGAHRAAAGA